MTNPTEGTDRGSYVEIDGRPAVRFVRTYPHPAERVWQAVTDPAELAHWFPSPEVSYEPRVGGAITLGGDPYDETRTAEVRVWEPPHRFGFEWGPDELLLTVTPAQEGCRFELVNFLSEREAAARNAAGWDVCLDELARTVAGTPGQGPHGDMADFMPVYDSYVADGLPSGAEIPS